MKIGYVIMRAQPFHSGHRHLVKRALSECKKVVIIIGSSNISRTMKNPWTFAERVAMISREMGIMNDRLIIVPQPDHPYDDQKWLSEIQDIVLDTMDGNEDPATFYAHAKPGNDYLDWFGEYRMVNVPAEISVSATKIRELMLAEFPKYLPEEVLEDYQYYALERTKMSSYPYADTLQFNCADAVLTCRGHVLLIRRKYAPGRGKLALPGGFKNANETFVDAAIRELVEETGIDIPENVLRENIFQTRLFDSPDRGQGIPRISLAVHIDVTDLYPDTPPKVCAMDDAEETFWVRISSVQNMNLFDDHAAIIETLL